MRGHKPLRHEAQHAPGCPTRPKEMSLSARRIWDRLVKDMDPAVLCRTDHDALATLCDDEGLLSDSYAALRKLVEVVRKEAAVEGKELPAGPFAAVLTIPQGRSILLTIRHLVTRVIVQRREFGLTPAARTRVDGGGRMRIDDFVDDALFNRPAEMMLQ